MNAYDVTSILFCAETICVPLCTECIGIEISGGVDNIINSPVTDFNIKQKGASR